ncbi:retrovirus-related pol polyprotein from transposon TNT 1-94 [Tanacetum coccineum]|uniref:Retrovirus-related pol polyprotein from transposon TNT 1-94 n=1 Tax=Tanacetum coccineum TaxID=301880 RepID=A0ABQ5HCW2_9ASTR
MPIAEHSGNSRSFSEFTHFVCLTYQKCVFNANHDTCVTKFMNDVNSRAKVQSYKTTNINKPVEQISIVKKPERRFPTGYRFSIKKTCTVHEKTTTPRSCLRWKPTGKIFKIVGLSSELKIQDHNNEPSSSKLVLNISPLGDTDAPSLQELDFLFSPLFEEYFTAENQSVSKSFAFSDNSQQQNTQPTLNVQPTTEPIIQLTTVNAEEKNTDQAVDAQFEPYEFINPFCTPVREDHHKNKFQEIHHASADKKTPTDLQILTCGMFRGGFTRETAELTNIKEVMADHAWIEAMQEELHQFNILKVWELVDIPFGKTIINLKCLWKNKKDEDNIVIRNKAQLVAKGYKQEEGINFEESFTPIARF